MSVLPNLSTDDLEKDIERLTAELEQRRKDHVLATMPKPVENPDWSRVQKMCQEVIDSLAKDNWYDDDMDHYIFEGAMRVVFGKDVFTWMNKRGR